MVERLLAKEKVAGSNPVFRSSEVHETAPIGAVFHSRMAGRVPSPAPATEVTATTNREEIATRIQSNSVGTAARGRTDRPWHVGDARFSAPDDPPKEARRVDPGPHRAHQVRSGTPATDQRETEQPLHVLRRPAQQDQPAGRPRVPGGVRRTQRRKQSSGAVRTLQRQERGPADADFRARYSEVLGSFR